jgi:hypothetical protein
LDWQPIGLSISTVAKHRLICDAGKGIRSQATGAVGKALVGNRKPHAGASMHTTVFPVHFHPVQCLQSGDNGEWRYVGGTTFNDKVPTHFTYSELAQRLNLKFGDTVSFR